ncbi:MAG: hypothetical protein DYH15_14550 [Nitrosomonas sp. PRO4]|nr:hypothetical protein [Nitrosomonas sp. PRO4]
MSSNYGKSPAEIRKAIRRLTIKIAILGYQRRITEAKRGIAYQLFNSLADISLSEKNTWLKRLATRLSCSLYPILNRLLGRSIDLIQQELNLTKTKRKLENALEFLNSLKTIN